MSGSKLRQDVQIRPSGEYVDTLAAGPTLETNAESAEDDLNAIRSQILRILALPNWHAALMAFTNVDGETIARGLTPIDAALDALETARFLCPVEVFTPTTVPAAANFVILSAASTETPTNAPALALNTLGAVAAHSALTAAAFEVHELITVAGGSSIRPKNILLIRDALTGRSIQSSDRTVFGLLAAESTTIDGDPFDDATARAKVSFVRLTATLDSLEAVPVEDIEGRVFHYVYSARARSKDLPEDCNALPSFFTLSVAASGSGGGSVDPCTISGFDEITYDPVTNRVTEFVTWSTSDRILRVVDQTFAYDGARVSSLVSRWYDADGITVLFTVTETPAYAGVLGNRIASITRVRS